MTYLTDRFGVTSTDNSTTSTLTASNTYTGTGEDVENYGDVTINVTSDVDGAVGGFQLQYSPDNTNWDIVETFTYTAPSTLVVNSTVKARYFRVVYINGSTGQSSFRLQTIVTQSKVGGNSNTSTTVKMDETSLDAFGRIKISNPHTLLDLTHTKDKNNMLITEDIAGTGTSVFNDPSSSVLMSVSANGDRVTRQSRRYTVYQPGKSLLIVATGVINAGSNGTNTTSKIGYFDDDNGFFFEYDGSGLNIVKRNNGSDTTIANSSWNVDKLDGTGNSGITLDPTKTLIYFFDIEWLGVGTVRTGVFVDGNPYIAHKFHHSNIETNTYMDNANLPIRYEIEATDTTSNTGSLRHICATVISEGGYNPLGKTFSANTGNTARTITSGTQEPLVSIRLKSSGTGARLRSTVNLSQFSVASTNTTGKIAIVRLWLFQDNTTALTAPSWTSANDESAVEYDVSATAITTTGGYLIQSLYFSNRIEIFANSIQSLIPMVANYAGTQDMLVVTAEPEGANADYLGSITWEEIF